jgi:D-alanine-D-alanine ligase
MPRYDSVLLYNTASMSETAWSQEILYSTNVLRDEVDATAEGLREAGFHPRVMAVDYFSLDLVREITKLSPRLIFNLCEEINYDCRNEMCVAGFLELLEIPYTGSGPLALGLALDKYRLKKLLHGSGIPTARGYLQSRGRDLPKRGGRFPLIVKPVHEDASLGINSDSICRDPEALQKQVAYIHEVYCQDALVEEFIEGREFNLSVLGNDPARVLPISEIDFSGLPDGEPQIVTYRAKWDEESVYYRGTEPVCPASVPKRLENRLKKVALRSYDCVGCRDYARVDVRVDGEGNIFVLEVNPNPDISPVAGFAKAARAEGMSYSDLIHHLAQLALERGQKVSAEAYALS